MVLNHYCVCSVTNISFVVYFGFEPFYYMRCDQLPFWNFMVLSFLLCLAICIFFVCLFVCFSKFVLFCFSKSKTCLFCFCFFKIKNVSFLFFQNQKRVQCEAVIVMRMRKHTNWQSNLFEFESLFLLVFTTNTLFQWTDE